MEVVVAGAKVSAATDFIAQANDRSQYSVIEEPRSISMRSARSGKAVGASSVNR